MGEISQNLERKKGESLTITYRIVNLESDFYENSLDELYINDELGKTLL